jgi:hypothetical protein
MIEVRATRDEDLPGLSALFEARFGHPLGVADWVWKYRQLPGTGRSMVAVDKGGAIVAHAGALCLPARWSGDGGQGEGGIWQLVDFAGAPRGSGLRPALVSLGRQLLADIPAAGEAPWIYGFPSERHFKLGERVFGYSPLTTLAPLCGEIPDVAGSGAIESGDSAGDWAAAAWERCGVLGVRRTAAFLNWRYWARPNRYYRFYRLCAASPAAPPGGTPSGGLAVFAFVGDEAWAAELWLPPEGEWYSAMLAVAADLRASGLRSWRFWPPPDILGTAPLLHRLGARPDGSTVFVGCRGAAGGFDYAMGDYDLV